MLVYAGDERWIQARPGVGAVVTMNGKTDNNAWFQVPVTTHRSITFPKDFLGKSDGLVPVDGFVIRNIHVEGKE